FGAVPGPVDRSAVDYRGDVLTFTSPALSSPLVLAGDLAATVSATCDRRSFDVSCVFSRVLPSGVAQPLSSGYVHLRQVPEAPVQVPMVATCVTLQPGERIRLSIAASDFPAHPINPGTGQNPMTSPAVEALVTTIVIRLGGADGSFIELPFLAS
ncbi:CocE/NonD family hydrolase C-terminal non-catalytic domain-containing protein, partial [Pseudomonas helleri]